MYRVFHISEVSYSWASIRSHISLLHEVIIFYPTKSPPCISEGDIFASMLCGSNVKVVASITVPVTVEFGIPPPLIHCKI